MMMKNISKFRKHAIVVLGGVVRKNKDGTWRTSNLFEKQNSHGSLGDSLRVEAAAILYQQNPDCFVIASGGKGSFKNIVGVPTVSRVIKSELLHLGVPASAIIVEEKSGNTYEQLQEIKKMFVKNFFVSIVLISNDWHLPRIRTMVKLDVFLNKMLERKRLVLKSAEKILINKKSFAWQKKVEKAYQQDEMCRIVKAEKRGVRNLLKGTYAFFKKI